MDRIIQMILQQVINRVMRAGINKGINAATKRNPSKTQHDMPADQQKQVNDRANAMRRFGRF